MIVGLSGACSDPAGSEGEDGEAGVARHWRSFLTVKQQRHFMYDARGKSAVTRAICALFV